MGLHTKVIGGDMRYVVIGLCLITLTACGTGAPTVTPAPTPTPTPLPTPTLRPTPTLSSLQLTAVAAQAKQQQANQAQQNNACKQVSDIYAQKGQVFDRERAARDPQLALVEFKIVRTGSNERTTSTLGKMMDNQYGEILFQCLGIPYP